MGTGRVKWGGLEGVFEMQLIYQLTYVCSDEIVHKKCFL